MNKTELQQKSKVEIKSKESLDIDEAGKVLKTIYQNIPKSVLEFDDTINVKIKHQFKGKITGSTYDRYDVNNMDNMEDELYSGFQITAPFLHIDLSYKGEIPDSVYGNNHKMYEDKRVHIEIDCTGTYCNWETEHEIDAKLKLEMGGCKAQHWNVSFYDGVQSRIQMAWGSRSEKWHLHRNIPVKNSQLLIKLLDEVLQNMKKTINHAKDYIDENDCNRAEDILVKNWEIPEIGMTKEKILEFASFAEEGLNLGKQLSPECKTELKQLKAKYNKLANGIEERIDKMDFEELMEISNKYMKEYCKEIKE
ncbi:MAG: hypothetical protein CL489_11890 [Acidobacteria bacterium]|nr:hypothetical protein [Acidobacteriota bacterium]